MKIYSDGKEGKVLTEINFGTVEALTEKEMTLWVKNDSGAVLENIEFRFAKLPSTETLEIMNAPTTMQPQAIVPMTIKWRPSLSFKQALKVALEVVGDSIYYAK
jgi:hypothetical protein